MFLRLLWESFVRQRRRKILAGLAILLGTTAVTAMLALATSIGDRIHQELAVYGANIVVTPKADQLAVKLGGVDLRPATGGAFLREADLAKLKTIFWANNITGISPELPVELGLVTAKADLPVHAVGVWFAHPITGSALVTGAPQLHPSWKLTGGWPADSMSKSVVFEEASPTDPDIVVGNRLAAKAGLHVGQEVTAYKPSNDDPSVTPLRMPLRIVGIVSTGDALDEGMLVPLALAQQITGSPGAVARVDVSARTKPEDAFARKDPDALPAKQREVWYCRPYANSIAYQIREAIPGAQAEQVRRVEQSEGSVLRRISGLMWLVSAGALLAAGFAVSAAMATAVLERRREIGLMRSLGAGRMVIAWLFYAESGVLAVLAGGLGYLAGSVLAWWLSGRIFAGDGASPVLVGVLLPIVLGLAVAVAVAGSTSSIQAALRMDPAAVLRADG